MGQRPQLHDLLKEVLGSEHVYFQPPASTKMEYPAIRYERDDIRAQYAGNRPYAHHKRYQLTHITRDPDDETPDELATLPKCAFDRRFVVDNLYHDVFTIYF